MSSRGETGGGLGPVCDEFKRGARPAFATRRVRDTRTLRARGAGFSQDRLVLVRTPEGPHADDLAVVDAVPCAEKVTLHNSGSEATCYAMRLARAYRKREKILKFEGGYHGMNDYALMSNHWTVQPADFPQPVPNSAGIPQRITEDVLVAPFNHLEHTVDIMREYSNELGGVIVEPLCRTMPPVSGFLEGLREVTRELDIPLIFDEVVTGFRLAFGGAQEFYAVTPDLCATGKVISCGHPLAVVCGRADIMDYAGPSTAGTSDHVSLTGTYSSNPISAAVALAVIGELKKPGVYEEVERKGSKLKNSLTDMLRQAKIPAAVIGEASAFQPWFTEIMSLTTAPRSPQTWG